MRKGFLLIIGLLLIFFIFRSVMYVQKQGSMFPTKNTPLSSPEDLYKPKNFEDGQFNWEEYEDSLSRTIPSNGTDEVKFKFPKYPLEITYPGSLIGYYHDIDLTPSGYTNFPTQLRLKKDDKFIIYIIAGDTGGEGPLYAEQEPLYIKGIPLVINGEKINKTRAYSEKPPIKKTNNYFFSVKYPSGKGGVKFICVAENSDIETICDQVGSEIKFTQN